MIKCVYLPFLKLILHFQRESCLCVTTHQYACNYLKAALMHVGIYSYFYIRTVLIALYFQIVKSILH